MASKRKLFKRGLSLVALGYAIGILTAPLSGKKTRDKLKNASNVKDIEKELKKVYSETRQAISKFAKENPKLTAKLKEVKAQAEDSQVKVKDLLSAIHGQDKIDEDLDAALNEAKRALESLEKYLTK